MGLHDPAFVLGNSLYVGEDGTPTVLYLVLSDCRSQIVVIAIKVITKRGSHWICEVKTFPNSSTSLHTFLSTNNMDAVNSWPCQLCIT